MDEIKTKVDEITYIINQQFQTATIDDYQSVKGDILIPKIIKFNNTEYEVTKISGKAFSTAHIKSLKFDPNSKITVIPSESFDSSYIEKITLIPKITIIERSAFYLCTRLKELEIPPNSDLQQIESDVFYDTQIENIIIPSKVTLFEGWNRNIRKLTKITVMPGNYSYIDVDHKYLLGKSNPENKNFDVLHFVSRSIINAKIPESVEIIDLYAFQFCKKMESFVLPHKIKRINKFAFSECKSLKKFVIPSNSKLQFFENRVFEKCPITSFVIPKHVKFFDDEAFVCLEKLLIILIEEDSELYHIDSMMFYGLKNVILMVPSNKIDCII